MRTTGVINNRHRNEAGISRNHSEVDGDKRLGFINHTVTTTSIEPTYRPVHNRIRNHFEHSSIVSHSNPARNSRPSLWLVTLRRKVQEVNEREAPRLSISVLTPSPYPPPLCNASAMSSWLPGWMRCPAQPHNTCAPLAVPDPIALPDPNLPASCPRCPDFPERPRTPTGDLPNARHAPGNQGH